MKSYSLPSSEVFSVRDLASLWDLSLPGTRKRVRGLMHRKIVRGLVTGSVGRGNEALFSRIDERVSLTTEGRILSAMGMIFTISDIQLQVPHLSRHRIRVFLKKAIAEKKVQRIKDRPGKYRILDGLGPLYDAAEYRPWLTKLGPVSRSVSIIVRSELAGGIYEPRSNLDIHWVRLGDGRLRYPQTLCGIKIGKYHIFSGQLDKPCLQCEILRLRILIATGWDDRSAVTNYARSISLTDTEKKLVRFEAGIKTERRPMTIPGVSPGG